MIIYPTRPRRATAQIEELMSARQTFTVYKSARSKRAIGRRRWLPAKRRQDGLLEGCSAGKQVDNWPGSLLVGHSVNTSSAQVVWDCVVSATTC